MLRPISYMDFEIEVVGCPFSGASVEIAARGPAGEARTQTSFSLSQGELESQLTQIRDVILQGTISSKRKFAKEFRSLQVFGKILFEFLFPQKISNLFRVSQAMAKSANMGLRVKLVIHEPTIAALPWEFVFDTYDNFLCLSTQTPIVRYLAIAQPLQSLVIQTPLRILGLVANPSELDPIDVAGEQERISNALSDLRARGLVEIEWLSGQSWQSLQRAMRKGRWHIFHYIGHGNFDPHEDESTLHFVSDTGEIQSIRAEQVGALLADHPTLRLIFLSACHGAAGGTKDLFSGVAAFLTYRGIPAVLSMQYNISDSAAVEFTSSFYECLAEGFPVDAAAVEGRKAIFLARSHSLEWGVPVLYMRSRDGHIFAAPTDSVLEDISATVSESSNLSSPISADDHEIEFNQLLPKVFDVYERNRGKPEDFRRELTQIGTTLDRIRQAIEWAISDSTLSKDVKLKAVTFLEGTEDFISYEFSEDYLEQMHWTSLLHSWTSIYFWRRKAVDIRAQAKRIGQNTFVSSKAEGDLYLFPANSIPSSIYTSQPPKIRPQWYKDNLRSRLDGSNSILVIGEEGSGKTASALILAWDELLSRRDTDVPAASTLPVYWRCEDNLGPATLISQYASAYARSLMGYLAATPYQFLQAGERQKNAMAQLLLLSNRSADELRLHISQHRMRRTPMPKHFFEVLDSLIGRVQYLPQDLWDMDPDRLLQILWDACPSQVSNRLPLIDVQVTSDAAYTTRFVNQIQLTLETLQRIGNSAIIFLPRLLKMDFGSPDMALDIEWRNAEIEQLLINRLLEVTERRQDDLGVLCDFRNVESLETIQQRVIEASLLRPGRLIRIIQRFIRHIQTTGELLNQEEVDGILSEFIYPTTSQLE